MSIIETDSSFDIFDILILIFLTYFQYSDRPVWERTPDRPLNSFGSVVVGVQRDEEGVITAYSDFRKPGAVDSF